MSMLFPFRSMFKQYYYSFFFTKTIYKKNLSYCLLIGFDFQVFKRMCHYRGWKYFFADNNHMRNFVDTKQ